MASRHPDDKGFILHAWCDEEGVDKTSGPWHHWGWYSTLAQANIQGARICETRWIGKDGTKYGRFQVFGLQGVKNGR